MSGTWPTARAAIVAQLDGLAFDAGGAYEAETLTMLEYPPASVQASILPYAYVIPPARHINRNPGAERETVFDAIRVRILLGSLDDLERSATRMEALAEALADAFDDAVALDGTVDVLLSQELGELAIQQPENMWGFDMTLGVSLSEVKTFSP